MAQTIFPLSGKRVWVAGHRGMVGRAIVRRLAAEGCTIVLPEARIDLRDQAATFAWMDGTKIDLVFLAAAKVGGIAANSELPGEFLYDNLMIEANVIEGARRAGVAKLVFLGSSCIFPKLAAQPMAESALLTGALEPTNEWYAIAKIAGPEALRRLSPPIWLRLHLGAADQPLRSVRQFRSGIEPCPASLDAQGA